MFFEKQTRLRGFKKGVSSVYNQPVISAMIFLTNGTFKYNSLENGVCSNTLGKGSTIPPIFYQNPGADLVWHEVLARSH